MTLDQAATPMGVSTRHTRRILAAYREEGAAALSHGNRGLRATNATPETTKAEVLRLARFRYSETNHTHLSELLREREGIDIARTTLRRILAGAGVKSPCRRRPPQHRVRRQRMPREGMLIQVDGSHHRWVGTPCLALRAAAGRRRCHGHRGQRPVLRAGEHPRLLAADEGSVTALRHTRCPLHRPALRLCQSPGSVLSMENAALSG